MTIELTERVACVCHRVVLAEPIWNRELLRLSEMRKSRTGSISTVMQMEWIYADEETLLVNDEGWNV